MCMFPNMPCNMRQTLLSDLVACFDAESSSIEYQDSGSSGERYFFEALHFSYYNRHCTRVRNYQYSVDVLMASRCQGHGVPIQAHPNQIARVDNSRTNYGQMLPYLSSDTRKYEHIYHNVGSIFGNVFEWIAQQVSL